MEKTRDGFKSRTGFVIACIGSAVGMGNIWRFPYMVSDWGGMTFLIPYVLFVILIGASGVIDLVAHLEHRRKMAQVTDDLDVFEQFWAQHPDQGAFEVFDE